MRKAIIGTIGILFTLLILCFTSCNTRDKVTVNDEKLVVDLPTGQRLHDVKFDNGGLIWYLTRPFEKGERATTYTLYTKDRGIKGTMMFVEHEADTSGVSVLDDIEDRMALEQLRRLAEE